MNIPPLNKLRVANPDGTMHEDLHFYFTQLITQMQQNLSNEGYVVPQQSSDDITNISTRTSDPRILVDQGSNELKFLVNGTVLTVQTAP